MARTTAGPESFTAKEWKDSPYKSRLRKGRETAVQKQRRIRREREDFQAKNKSPSKKAKEQTFKQAFAAARTPGKGKTRQKTFSWKNPSTGKTEKYTTRQKGEGEVFSGGKWTKGAKDEKTTKPKTTETKKTAPKTSTKTTTKPAKDSAKEGRRQRPKFKGHAETLKQALEQDRAKQNKAKTAVKPKKSPEAIARNKRNLKARDKERIFGRPQRPKFKGHAETLKSALGKAEPTASRKVTEAKKAAGRFSKSVMDKAPKAKPATPASKKPLSTSARMMRDQRKRNAEEEKERRKRRGTPTDFALQGRTGLKRGGPVRNKKTPIKSKAGKKKGFRS